MGSTIFGEPENLRGMTAAQVATSCGHIELAAMIRANDQG
jgi:hypothetical protein